MERQTGQERLEAAFRVHQSGRLADALPLYERYIESDFHSDVAHNLLGTVLCGLGRLPQGEAHFRIAVDLNAANADALNNLASVRKDLGDPIEAERCYRRVLELRPDFATAWSNLGLLFLQMKRVDDAIACLGRATALDPGNADAHNNLGAGFRLRGQLLEAESEFRAAIAADSALPEGWCGLADVLFSRSLLDEAEVCCRKALEVRPRYADAINNFASIAKARENFERATSLCEEALAIEHNHIGALNNLGSIATRRADHAKAETIYRSALAIDPGNAVTRFNLSTVLLTKGCYREGFELYESRFAAFPGALTKYRWLNQKLSTKPQWRGESLRGKRLLIWAEQGLGDCIMMLRYLPEVRTRSPASITVVCDPSLRRLVENMNVADLVIDDDTAVEAIEFDAHCPMISLPLAFGTTLESIPAVDGYISVPKQLVNTWRLRLGIRQRPRVGLCWAGSINLRDDARRSIPLESLSPILSVANIDFVSLQKGEAADEWRRSQRMGDEHIDACSDFLDTAALLMNLDLVISVDTAVAHLAGALARPVWLLNRFAGDWRWGCSSATAPWYLTMRLIHEGDSHRWRDVLDRVHTDLSNETWGGERSSITCA